MRDVKINKEIGPTSTGECPISPRDYPFNAAEVSVSTAEGLVSLEVDIEMNKIRST